MDHFMILLCPFRSFEKNLKKKTLLVEFDIFVLHHKSAWLLKLILHWTILVIHIPVIFTLLCREVVIFAYQKCMGFCSVWLYKGTAVTCSHHSNTTIQTLFLGLCLQSIFTQTAFWVFSWQTDERELECKQEADLWIRRMSSLFSTLPVTWLFFHFSHYSPPGLNWTSSWVLLLNKESCRLKTLLDI